MGVVAGKLPHMTADAKALNEALITSLRAYGGPIRSDPVDAAFRAVPRHLFVPEVTVEDAYVNDAVITKRHPDGSSLSSASAPSVVAMMLEQLDVRPGHRVLEIGAGTGYNAALLARMGADVTTIEYDGETAERARLALAEAGFPDVVVVSADGAHGHVERAPYDRLIATTGVWEVPSAWLRQLAPDGRLVVPLRLPGWSLSIAFERAGDHWRSLSFETCGFIPMEGAAGRPPRRVALTDGVTLVLDDDHEGAPDPFSQPGQVIWTGVTVDHRGRSPYEPLLLWLASSSPGFCKVTATADAIEAGAVAPLFTWGGAAVWTDDGFAYLTNRRVEPGIWEIGVIGHGPGVAQPLADRVRGWNPEQQPRIELHPAHTPDERLRGAYVIDKRDSRIAVYWPDLVPRTSA
jgi:protein-L-isoaspartate(D-aspartate) O-methyltransferase